jgi:hypothetical protein
VRSSKSLEPTERYNILKKCKDSCNFCNFYVIDRLYPFLAGFEYHQIKEILGLASIISNKWILSDIVIKMCDNISFSDLLIILDQKTLTDIPARTVIKICNNILLAAKTSSLKSDNMSVKLLQKIISNDSLLTKHYDIIMNFVLDMLDAKLVDKIADLGIHLADFSMLLEQALSRITDKSNFYCIGKIVNESSFFRVTKKFFPRLSDLPEDLFESLCMKLDNIIEYISFISYPESYSKIHLVIDPKNIAKSLNLDKPSEELEIFLDDISSRKNIFVEYRTETGIVGYDAGGLTKDFYTLLASEITSECEEVDDFVAPKRDSKFSDKVWFFYGIMIARSIFRENISPGINLHPVLCYMMINGVINMKMKHFFCEMEPFEIDYLSSMKKVLNMSTEGYIEFMELQCEDPIPKAKYIGAYIYNKYLYPSTLNFISGFRTSFARYYNTRFLSLITVFRYIKGEWKYDIVGNSSHSLKNNLKIVRDTDYEDQIIVVGSAYYLKLKAFEKDFLGVLEHLNNTNISKLKLFIKFWFGTSSISSFGSNKGKIYITNNRLYECFKSNTCFNQLHIESTHIKTGTGLSDTILKLIDNTLTNQQLSESAGYRMQFM